MLRLRLFSGTVFVGLFLDQLSKWLVMEKMSLYQSIELIRNFFHLSYVRNPGAAFGLLANSPLRLPLFIAISTLALIGIFWYLWKKAPATPQQHLGLGLVFSGALGNLIDRIRFHEVIDFIDVHWYRLHWPAFNIADSAICVGVGLLLLDSFHQSRTEKRSEIAD